MKSNYSRKVAFIVTKTAFTNCNLFVGTQDEILKDAWFIIDDTTSKIIAKGTGIPYKKADKSIDLENQYVMSGLLNSHVHITNWFPETETIGIYNAFANLKAALKGGVTYIRSCGVPFDTDIKLNNMRTQYPFEGPQIMPSGMPISILGGHGDQLLGENHAQNASHLVNGISDIQNAVRSQVNRREVHIRIRFRVLTMAPDNLEVVHLRIVGRSLVAGDGRKVREVERTAEFISLAIRGMSGDTPRPFCIDFASQRQVNIIVDSEIITAVAQIESTVVVIAETREDDTARIIL